MKLNSIALSWLLNIVTLFTTNSICTKSFDRCIQKSKTRTELITNLVKHGHGRLLLSFHKVTNDKDAKTLFEQQPTAVKVAIVRHMDHLKKILK
jgi:hypothetical protein